MALIEGGYDASIITVLIDDVVVSHQISNSISTTKDGIEVTTKQSGGNKRYIYGEFDAEIECEAMHAFDSTYGYDDLLDAQLNDTTVVVKIAPYSSGAEVAANYRLFGNALVFNLNWNAPQNDRATFSCTLKISGGLTKETIT